MKKARTMGLIVAMALSLTASLAVASASASQFRAEEYPTPVTGTQVAFQEIGLKAGNFKCTTATASGTASEASSALTVTPTFSGCKLAGIAASASANSCKYVFHSTNGAAPYTGSMDIACSKEGDAITIGKEGCQVTLLPQSSLGAVALANSGTASGRAVTATLNITGLKYTQSATCSGGAGTFTTGTYVGSSKITGFNEKAGHSVGVYVANEQIEEPTGLKAESYPVRLIGTPTRRVEFAFNSGFIQCSSASVEGIVTGPKSALNLVFAMSCKPALITNGCYFNFNVTSSAPPSSSGYYGIACGKAGSVMEATLLGACKVTIPAQANIGGVSFQNVGSGATRTIDMSLNAGSIQYTEASTGSCSKPGTHTDGKMIGEIAVKGFQDMEGVPGAQEGIWVE